MKTEVIVAGLGSIGQRHVKILKGLGAKVTTVSRRGNIGDAKNISEVLMQKPDALLLIATETSSHKAVIKLAENAGHRGPVVVEKPLGLDVSEFSGWRPASSVWVAYNMRYLPLMQAFKETLNSLDERILSVTAYAGQFLGEWRPGRDISETYSARKAEGGGVLRDLSHELDLLIWLWGEPECLAALGGRLGNITVDSDDCWNILMRTKEGTFVSLGLNYMDRPAKRFLHAVGEFTTISANIVDGTLAVNGEISHYAADKDASYRAMWMDILAACANGYQPQACNLSEGILILSLINKCERSAIIGDWIAQ